MGQNPNPSLQDSGQIIKRVYDQSNDAIRVEVGTGTTFGISISADSGDSVTVVPNVFEVKAHITSTNSGVIVAATPCIGIKTFNLYTNTTTTITGAQACTLEVSPSDTDNVWIASSLTITPSTVATTVVLATVTTIVARRARVSIAAAISTGVFDIYLVAQSV